MKIHIVYKHDFLSIFDLILATPERPSGASWGAHVADQVTFWELQEVFKNDAKIDIHGEVNKNRLEHDFDPSWDSPEGQKYCKTEGI